MDTDVVVVGAGHNGLVAAGYLARAGLRVVMFERLPHVGGAAVTEELWPGFHFSPCAHSEVIEATLFRGNRGPHSQHLAKRREPWTLHAWSIA